MYKLLGVEVDPFDLNGLLAEIGNAITAKRRLIVASQNIHSIYTYHRNQPLRALHEIAIKRIDGMPIVYLGKLLGYPLSRDHRLTWVDLIMPLMNEAALKNWKVFYLGADEVSVTKGVEKLKEEFPKLYIEYRNGFFDASVNSAENAEIIARVNKYEPDVLIVGMGMPRQEKWIFNNKEALNAKVIMTCGAAIEYVAGTVKTPPRWMGRVGLEWFYRFSENPARFWFRYLVEPWYILRLFAKDSTKKYILRKQI